MTGAQILNYSERLEETNERGLLPPEPSADNNSRGRSVWKRQVVDLEGNVLASFMDHMQFPVGGQVFEAGIFQPHQLSHFGSR